MRESEIKTLQRPETEAAPQERLAQRESDDAGPTARIENAKTGTQKGRRQEVGAQSLRISYEADKARLTCSAPSITS